MGEEQMNSLLWLVSVPVFLHIIFNLLVVYEKTN